jgi:histidinol dehydrogenase
MKGTSRETVMLPIYSWNTPEIRSYLDKICSRGSEIPSEVDQSVQQILREVRTQGDSALRKFTKEFDGIELANLRIDPEEIRSLAAQVDPGLREVLRLAKENIRRFHQFQMEKSWEIDAEEGVRLGQRIQPLQSVGLYVPGGTAAYPSTVLMNAIPAQIAGVPRIAVVTPCPQLRKSPVIAAVLEELNLAEVYGIGGAQAVAALAFGTPTIPRVDKIVGPGNIYVATAKRQVFGVVDIDMIAGPSEVVVVADESVDPDFVAADLMAQAEHDENACAIALTLSRDLATSIQHSLASQIKNLSREKVIRKSLENYGAIIIATTWDEVAEAINTIAPEHLELLLENPEPLADKIHSAGAIFFGPYSCEPVGDYFAGPNHVLPTSGTARFASPLGVYDFLKRTSLIRYSQSALQKNRTYIETFALAEHLDAHAQSVRVRFKKR